MKDFQSLYQGIWATIAFLEQHNFNVVKNGSNYFFSLRDERTPSALINKNGSVYDFGSGFYGSVYDVLERTNKLPAGMSKIEALNYCREQLMHYAGKPYVPQESHPINTTQSDKSPIDLAWYRQTFLRLDLLQGEYKKLLRETITSTRDEAVIMSVADKFLIGFSRATERDCARLVMPIFDVDGNITTLWRYNPLQKKHNRLRFVKGRKRSSFNLQSVISDDKNQMILICEGEKDVLNATARGFLAVTPGSAISRFSEDELKVFKDRDVMSIGDYDEAGESFNEANQEQLKGIVKSFSVGSWEQSVYGEIPKGYDLTDYLTFRK